MFQQEEQKSVKQEYYPKNWLNFASSSDLQSLNLRHDIDYRFRYQSPQFDGFFDSQLGEGTDLTHYIPMVDLDTREAQHQHSEALEKINIIINMHNSTGALHEQHYYKNTAQHFHNILVYQGQEILPETTQVCKVLNSVLVKKETQPEFEGLQAQELFYESAHSMVHENSEKIKELHEKACQNSDKIVQIVEKELQENQHSQIDSIDIKNYYGGFSILQQLNISEETMSQANPYFNQSQNRRFQDQQMYGQNQQNLKFYQYQQQSQNESEGDKFLHSYFVTTSMCTDSTFIYIYIADLNKGQMLKIGTGNNGTIEGKIYIQKNIQRSEIQASWVFLNGFIYLTTTLCNDIDPESENFKDFQFQKIQQICPEKLEVVKTFSLDFLKDIRDCIKNNKFYFLMTDNKNLYVLMKEKHSESLLKNLDDKGINQIKTDWFSLEKESAQTQQKLDHFTNQKQKLIKQTIQGYQCNKGHDLQVIKQTEEDLPCIECKSYYQYVKQSVYVCNECKVNICTSCISKHKDKYFPSHFQEKTSQDQKEKLQQFEKEYGECNQKNEQIKKKKEESKIKYLVIQQLQEAFVYDIFLYQFQISKEQENKDKKEVLIKDFQKTLIIQLEILPDLQEIIRHSPGSQQKLFSSRYIEEQMQRLRQGNESISLKSITHSHWQISQCGNYVINYAPSGKFVFSTKQQDLHPAIKHPEFFSETVSGDISQYKKEIELQTTFEVVQSIGEPLQLSIFPTFIFTYDFQNQQFVIFNQQFSNREVHRFEYERKINLQKRFNQLPQIKYCQNKYKTHYQRSKQFFESIPEVKLESEEQNLILSILRRINQIDQYRFMLEFDFKYEQQNTNTLFKDQIKNTFKPKNYQIHQLILQQKNCIQLNEQVLKALNTYFNEEKYQQAQITEQLLLLLLNSLYNVTPYFAIEQRQLIVDLSNNIYKSIINPGISQISKDIGHKIITNYFGIFAISNELQQKWISYLLDNEIQQIEQVTNWIDFNHKLNISPNQITLTLMDGASQDNKAPYPSKEFHHPEIKIQEGVQQINLQKDSPKDDVLKQFREIENKSQITETIITCRAEMAYSLFQPKLQQDKHTTWSFKIQSTGKSIAFGIVSKAHVEQNKYAFYSRRNKDYTAKMPHGGIFVYYSEVTGRNGLHQNCYNSQQNHKQTSFRIQNGDTIHVLYDPTKRHVRFNRNGSTKEHHNLTLSYDEASVKKSQYKLEDMHVFIALDRQSRVQIDKTNQTNYNMFAESYGKLLLEEPYNIQPNNPQEDFQKLVKFVSSTYKTESQIISQNSVNLKKQIIQKFIKNIKKSKENFSESQKNLSILINFLQSIIKQNLAYVHYHEKKVKDATDNLRTVWGYQIQLFSQIVEELNEIFKEKEACEKRQAEIQQLKETFSIMFNSFTYYWFKKLPEKAKSRIELEISKNQNNVFDEIIPFLEKLPNEPVFEETRQIYFQLYYQQIVNRIENMAIKYGNNNSSNLFEIMRNGLQDKIGQNIGDWKIQYGQQHIVYYVEQISKQQGEFSEYAQKLIDHYIQKQQNSFQSKKSVQLIQQQSGNICVKLLILVILYHNGMLESDFSKYQISDQIEEAIQKVIAHMTVFISGQQELQNIQNKYKDMLKKQISQQEIMQNIESYVYSTFNKDGIKQLEEVCRALDTQFYEKNIQKTQKEFLEQLKQNLLQQKNFQEQSENLQELTIQKIIKKSIFLLQLRSMAISQENCEYSNIEDSDNESIGDFLQEPANKEKLQLQRLNSAQPQLDRSLSNNPGKSISIPKLSKNLSLSQQSQQLGSKTLKYQIDKFKNFKEQSPLTNIINYLQCFTANTEIQMLELEERQELSKKLDAILQQQQENYLALYTNFRTAFNDFKRETCYTPIFASHKSLTISLKQHLLSYFNTIQLEIQSCIKEKSANKEKLIKCFRQLCQLISTNFVWEIPEFQITIGNSKNLFYSLYNEILFTKLKQTEEKRKNLDRSQQVIYDKLKKESDKTDNKSYFSFSKDHIKLQTLFYYFIHKTVLDSKTQQKYFLNQVKQYLEIQKEKGITLENLSQTRLILTLFKDYQNIQQKQSGKIPQKHQELHTQVLKILVNLVYTTKQPSIIKLIGQILKLNTDNSLFNQQTVQKLVEHTGSCITLQQQQGDSNQLYNVVGLPGEQTKGFSQILLDVFLHWENFLDKEESKENQDQNIKQDESYYFSEENSHIVNRIVNKDKTIIQGYSQQYHEKQAVPSINSKDVSRYHKTTIKLHQTLQQLDLQDISKLSKEELKGIEIKKQIIKDQLIKLQQEYKHEERGERGSLFAKKSELSHNFDSDSGEFSDMFYKENMKAYKTFESKIKKTSNYEQEWVQQIQQQSEEMQLQLNKEKQDSLFLVQENDKSPQSGKNSSKEDKEEFKQAEQYQEIKQLDQEIIKDDSQNLQDSREIQQSELIFKDQEKILQLSPPIIDNKQIPQMQNFDNQEQFEQPLIYQQQESQQVIPPQFPPSQLQNNENLLSEEKLQQELIQPKYSSQESFVPSSYTEYSKSSFDFSRQVRQRISPFMKQPDDQKSQEDLQMDLKTQQKPKPPKKYGEPGNNVLGITLLDQPIDPKVSTSWTFRINKFDFTIAFGIAKKSEMEQIEYHFSKEAQKKEKPGVYLISFTTSLQGYQWNNSVPEQNYQQIPIRFSNNNFITLTYEAEKKQLILNKNDSLKPQNIVVLDINEEFGENEWYPCILPHQKSEIQIVQQNFIFQQVISDLYLQNLYNFYVKNYKNHFDGDDLSTLKPEFVDKYNERKFLIKVIKQIMNAEQTMHKLHLKKDEQFVIKSKLSKQRAKQFAVLLNLGLQEKLKLIDIETYFKLDKEEVEKYQPQNITSSNNFPEFIWQWRSRLEGDPPYSPEWTSYSDKDQKKLNEAYAQGELEVKCNQYTVCLETMLQYHSKEKSNRRERQVQKIPKEMINTSDNLERLTEKEQLYRSGEQDIMSIIAKKKEAKKAEVKKEDIEALQEQLAIMGMQYTPYQIKQALLDHGMDPNQAVGALMQDNYRDLENVIEEEEQQKDGEKPKEEKKEDQEQQNEIEQNQAENKKNEKTSRQKQQDEKITNLINTGADMGQFWTKQMVKMALQSTQYSPDAAVLELFSGSYEQYRNAKNDSSDESGDDKEQKQPQSAQKSRKQSYNPRKKSALELEDSYLEEEEQIDDDQIAEYLNMNNLSINSSVDLEDEYSNEMYVMTLRNQKCRVIVSLCENQIYKVLKNPECLSPSYFKDNEINSLVSINNKSGQSQSLIIIELLRILSNINQQQPSLLQQAVQELLQNFVSNSGQNNQLLSYIYLLQGWYHKLVAQNMVNIQGQNLYIQSGGYRSGKKSVRFLQYEFQNEQSQPQKQVVVVDYQQLQQNIKDQKQTENSELLNQISANQVSELLKQFIKNYNSKDTNCQFNMYAVLEFVYENYERFKNTIKQNLESIKKLKTEQSGNSRKQLDIFEIWENLQSKQFKSLEQMTLASTNNKEIIDQIKDYIIPETLNDLLQCPHIEEDSEEAQYFFAEQLQKQCIDTLKKPKGSDKPNRLLEYWEKYIIPYYEFLIPIKQQVIEFLKDDNVVGIINFLFMQLEEGLSSELDYEEKKAKVERKIPNVCHDCSFLTVDELQIGKMYQAKVSKLLTPYFKHFTARNINFVPVQLIALLNQQQTEKLSQNGGGQYFNQDKRYLGGRQYNHYKSNNEAQIALVQYNDIWNQQLVYSLIEIDNMARQEDSLKFIQSSINYLQNIDNIESKYQQQLGMILNQLISKIQAKVELEDQNQQQKYKDLLNQIDLIYIEKIQNFDWKSYVPNQISNKPLKIDKQFPVVGQIKEAIKLDSKESLINLLENCLQFIKEHEQKDNSWNINMIILDILTTEIILSKQVDRKDIESVFTRILKEQFVLLKKNYISVFQTCLKQDIQIQCIRIMRKIKVWFFNINENLSNLNINYFENEQAKQDFLIGQLKTVKLLQQSEEANSKKKNSDQGSLYYSQFLLGYIEFLSTIIGFENQVLGIRQHEYLDVNQEEFRNIVIIQNYLTDFTNKSVLSHHYITPSVDQDDSGIIVIANLPEKTSQEEVIEFLQSDISNRRILNPQTDVQVNSDVAVILTSGSKIQVKESLSKSLSEIPPEYDLAIQESMMGVKKDYCKYCKQILNMEQQAEPNDCLQCSKLIQGLQSKFKNSQILFGKQIRENEKAKQELQRVLKERLIDSQNRLQDKVLQILRYSYSQITMETKKEIIHKLNLEQPDYKIVENMDSFIQYFEQYVNSSSPANENVLNSYQILRIMGYDYLFDKAFYQLGQQPSSVPFSTVLKVFQQVFEVFCYGNPENIEKLSENNIRFALQKTSEQQPINVARQSIGKFTEIDLKDIKSIWKFVVENLNPKIKSISSMVNFLQAENFIQLYNDSNQQQLFNLNLACDFNQILQPLWIQTDHKQLLEQMVSRTAVKDLSKYSLCKTNIYVFLNLNKEKEKTVTPQFIQASSHLMQVHSAELRPIQTKKHGQSFLAFDVIMSGSSGEGIGLYYEFFSEITADLKNQNTYNGQILNLLKANNTNTQYMINPSAKSQYNLGLFKFLGVLMACCIRTGVHISINLPKLFWKLLIKGEQITLQDMQQLEYEHIDGSIEDIFSSNLLQQVKEYDMYENLEQRDDIVKEYLNDPKYQTNKDNIEGFQQLYSQAVLSLYQKQLESIKKGLYSVVPQAYFGTISSRQLEQQVCGINNIDLEYLIKNTRYEGYEEDGQQLSENSNRIQFLWQALREDFIDENYRKKFIKFTIGDDRLPDFEKQGKQFIIQAKKNKHNKNPDLILPTSSICFFMLKLPNYSSKQVLVNQLNEAISGFTQIAEDAVVDI